MIQKYNLKRPDRGELYRYVMIKHEHESDNFIPKVREINRQLYYNWRYHAATDGLNVSRYALLINYCSFLVFELQFGEH